MPELVALPGCLPGQQVYRIDNGELALAFLPEVGGRLISAQVGGRELLWRHPEFFAADLRPLRPRSNWPTLDGTMGSWTNLGGAKTWPAPQGWDGPQAWPGPPDPVLDSGAYRLQVHRQDAATLVELVSQADSYTGLGVTRSFRVPDAGSRFTQTITFCNQSRRTVRWAIWEVVQLAGDGVVAVAVDGNQPPTVLADGYGQLCLPDAVGGWLTFPVQPVVAKRGFPTATGQLAFRRPDAGLSIDFAVQPNATYPDQGSRAEVWLQTPTPAPLAEFGDFHPRHAYTELEVLSELRTLAPGASHCLELTWTLTAGEPGGYRLG